ncbi:YcbX family protein [Vibrio sp. RC27]
MSQLELSQVTVYPVKSIAGVSFSSVWVEKQGLTFDRRFMLALYNGRMVTARRFPQMVKIRSAFLANGIRFSYPNKSDLVIQYHQFDLSEVETSVWSDTFSAYSTTKQASEWFSDIVGEPVQLLYSGEQSNRVREKFGHNVSFADGYPLLLIGEASLEELNSRSSEDHKMAQFRPNLVVAGGEPFAEDKWKKIRIGEVEFLISKPCERCVLTTVDVEKGDFRPSQEPLKTLATFRADERGGIFFGQNLVPLNEGFIHQNDVVEVLEYQDGDHYEDNTHAANLLDADNALATDNDTSHSTLNLKFNGVSILGNNQFTLLEQSERNGVPIASSCRAGLCGACRVKVTKGEVEQQDAPALAHIDTEAGMVLACCCVPLTDVEIEF